jgi:hypothetical protein
MQNNEWENHRDELLTKSLIELKDISHVVLNVTIFTLLFTQETIRVKEEEIHQLAMDLKSRDCTIKELSDRLIESTDTAESSAVTVCRADKECKQALSEVDHLRKQLVQAVQQVN